MMFRAWLDARSRRALAVMAPIEPEEPQWHPWSPSESRRCKTCGAFPFTDPYCRVEGSKLSDYDRAHIGEIVSGTVGDWFSARLIRLLTVTDLHNRELLRSVYPDHVEAFEAWQKG